MEGYNLILLKDSFAAIQRLLMAEFSDSKNDEAKNDALRKAMSNQSEKEKEILKIVTGKL
jgi:hypothetical protein